MFGLAELSICLPLSPIQAQAPSQIQTLFYVYFTQFKTPFQQHDNKNIVFCCLKMKVLFMLFSIVLSVRSIYRGGINKEQPTIFFLCGFVVVGRGLFCFSGGPLVNGFSLCRNRYDFFFCFVSSCCSYCYKMINIRQ